MSYYRKSITAINGFLCIIVAFGIVSCGNRPGDAFYDGIIRETGRLFDAGDRQGAKHFLDSASHANPEGPPAFRMKRYFHLAHMAYLDHKLDTNKLMLDSQLAIMEQYKLQETYRKEYVELLNDRGYVYLRENNLDKSLEFFSRGRLMAYGTDDSCSYVGPTYALGMVTYKQKKYSEAIKFFGEAYFLNNKCPWTIYIFYKKEELLLNIGLAYNNLKNYDSAGKYLHSALNLADSAEQLFPNDTNATNFKRVANGVIKGNLANILIEQGRPDTAIQLLKENIAVNDRPGRDMKDAMFSRMRLAELYYQTGDHKATFAELNKLQHTLDTLPNNEIRSRALHLLYLYHKKTGNIVAGDYFDRYQALKDSMELSANELKKTDYAALLKDKDTQYRIALLTRDNKENRLYLGIALLSAALAVLIIVLVYRSYKRSKKNVTELTALNRRVNEQKQELEHTMTRLRETSDAKDRILHVVAHDLRSPVSGIMSLAPLIQEETDSDSQNEMMELITTASASAMSLIDEILQYSDNVVKTFVTEKTDIGRLAAQSVALLQLKANYKEQKIVFTPPPQPLYAMAHKEKMARVLNNLLNNAIKFSPHGTEIELLVSGNGTHVTIEVRDRGIGIPAASLPHVFDLFTTSKRYGTDGEVSFGLGLSICMQIVTAHNGRIWVESTEGTGSSFFVELSAAI